MQSPRPDHRSAESHRPWRMSPGDAQGYIIKVWKVPLHSKNKKVHLHIYSQIHVWCADFMPNPILTSPAAEWYWGMLLGDDQGGSSPLNIQSNGMMKEEETPMFRECLVWPGRYMAGWFYFVSFLKFWLAWDYWAIIWRKAEIMKILPHLKIKDLFPAFFIRGLSTESQGTRTQQVLHIGIQMGVCLVPAWDQSELCLLSFVWPWQISQHLGLSFLTFKMEIKRLPLSKAAYENEMIPVKPGIWWARHMSDPW